MKAPALEGDFCTFEEMGGHPFARKPLAFLPHLTFKNDDAFDVTLKPGPVRIPDRMYHMYTRKCLSLPPRTIVTLPE
jgi:hypothetical protein